jgi:hypothetical protein
MNLGLFRKENLQSGDSKMVGDAVVDQFQRTHGALTAWQEVEHTDDGHHTDIHATSVTIDPGGLTVKGDVSSGDGGFTGEGGNVAIGDLPNEGTPLQSGGYGIKIGKWRIISDPNNSPSTPGFPGLIFQYLPETIGNFLFRFIRLGTFDYALAPQTGLQLALGWGTNRLSNVITAALTCIGVANVGSLVSNGNIDAAGSITCLGNVNGSNVGVNSGGAYYENGRVLGYWSDVPYYAGNFITYPSGSFTVGAGNVIANTYTVIGKTMHWTVNVQAATIGGAPQYLLFIVPNGLLTQANWGLNAVGLIYDGSGVSEGYAYPGNSTQVIIEKKSGAAFTAGPAYIKFSITLRLQ